MAKEAVTIPWRVAQRPDNEVEDTALVHLDALYSLGLRPTHNRAEAEDDVVSCPLGTVMSRLSRGRPLLRHALGRLARERGDVKEDE